MAELNLGTITDGNVYKNNNSFYGKVEEITWPAIKPTMIEQKVLSLKSKLKLPSGLDEMTCKIKYNSIDQQSIGQAANIYRGQDIHVRGNMEQWEGDAKIGDVPVIANLRGKISDNNGIGLKPGDSPDMEETYSITAYELIIDGVQIWKIDVINNIYIVEGVDLWAQRRANLGLQ